MFKEKDTIKIKNKYIYDSFKELYGHEYMEEKIENILLEFIEESYNSKKADEEIKSIKKQNENLRVDNEILNEEIDTYKNKIEDIKSGKLVLINEEEKKKIEKEVSKIEEAYDSLQEMLSEEELMSGICNDGISDYYYEKYYISIKAMKNALKDNFKLNIDLPSVEEIMSLKRREQNSLVENAIKLGRYL